MSAEYFWDVEQNSEEWFELRRGILTSSEFVKAIAQPGPRGGKPLGRTKLLQKLAGERITGEVESGWSGNAHTERGHEREDEARTLYNVIAEGDVKTVGFVRNGRVGASPDTLVGKRGLVEIKNCIGSIQIERLLGNRAPPEYVAQMHGQMMVCEREWCDFLSYCRGLRPLIVRVPRDDRYIDMVLRPGVNRFCDELDALTETIREMK